MTEDGASDILEPTSDTNHVLIVDTKSVLPVTTDYKIKNIEFV